MEKPVTNNLTDVQNANIESFMVAREYLRSSIELLHSMMSSKDGKNIESDLEKIITLLEASKSRMAECDIEVLNDLINGWGDISNVFIKGVDYYISAFKKRDKSNLIRGDALLIDCDKWVEKNQIEIINKISSKQAYLWKEKAIIEK